MDFDDFGPLSGLLRTVWAERFSILKMDVTAAFEHVYGLYSAVPEGNEENTDGQLQTKLVDEAKNAPFPLRYKVISCFALLEGIAR